MMIRRFSIAVMLMAGALAVNAQDSAAPEEANRAAARERLESYLEATQTLRARFRSVLLDERRSTLAESAGQVALKRPGRFRWEYTVPSPSLLIADGESLWSFDPELEQAVVRRMDDMDGANPTQLLGGDADLERDFDVVGAYRAAGVDWVEVTPRAIASDFDTIRLGFVDGTVTMMELGDKLGQVTQILFEDVEINTPLADAQFEFVPPPGTDIVGAP